MINRRVFSIVIQVILGVTILGVAAVLLLDHFGIAKTVKPFVVMSGSMEPAVKLGSVVVARPQVSYQPGDIITFAPNGDRENPVTHRIVFRRSLYGLGSESVYLTAGDANEDFDRWQVRNEHIIGKALFSIPYLGYLVNFAKQPYGFILLVIVPATIVIYEELKLVGKELVRLISVVKNKLGSLKSKKMASFRGVSINLLSKQERRFPKAGAFIPVIGATLVLASLSASFFLDSEISLGNILGAAGSFDESSEPTPTPTPTPTEIGPGDVVINEINWVGSTGDGLDEWIELLNITSETIDISNWVVENLGTGSGPGANITIPSVSIIPANGFFLISQHDKEGSRINVDSDYVTTSVSLSNGGEQLLLKTDTNVLIDTANGTGAWFEGSNSTPKKTMERKSPPGDGTIASNWQTATTHTNMDGSGPTDEFGTPKAANGL